MDEARRGSAPTARGGHESLDPARCRLVGEVRRTAQRVEHRAVSPTGAPVLVVRAVPGADPADVLYEADLLVTLAGRGASAFPEVLGRSASAYVREEATPWSIRRGRRSADVGSPRTQERRAQAAAREALDGSIARLHEQGRVLGLTGLEGLGVRDDGSVMIRDLSRLAPSGTVRGRLADQRWIDGVLGDQGRTLRRRVDGHDAPAGHGWSSASGDASPADPGPLAPDALPGRSADGGPAGMETRSDTARPAPASMREAAGSPPRRRRIMERSGRRAPVSWRVYLAGAAVVCAGTTAAVLAGAGAQSPPDLGPSISATPAPTFLDSTGRPTTAPGPAVRPADPRGLLEALAAARREHLIGGAPDTATAPGSPAAEEDARLAEAYRDVAVSGWVTRVASAEVVAVDGEAGTASLRATVQESERSLTATDGTSRTVPASPEHEIVADLVWEDGRWVLHAVRPA